MQPITPQNIHSLSDDDIQQQVACYGILWDPRDSMCSQDCAAYARCGYRLASATLPQIASEAGLTEADMNAGTLTPKVHELTSEHVSEVFETPDYAVEYAKALYENPSIGLPVIQPNGQLSPSGAWPHQMPFHQGLEAQTEGQEVLDGIQKGVDVSGDVSAGEIGEDGKMVKDSENAHAVGEADVVSELAASAQNTIEQAIEESSAEDVTFGVDDTEQQGEEEQVAAPKKKATKKKVTKKKTTKKKVVRKTATAKKTPSKKSVTKKKTVAKKASTKKAPTKKATKKKVTKKAAASSNPPQAPKQKKPSQAWGPDTFQARFNKDLQKPYIQEMAWGSKLTKEFQGETHTVQITQKGWKYKGELYPTLYTVMCAIKEPKEYPAQLTESGDRPAGKRTMASMSAPRFFGLEKRR